MDDVGFAQWSSFGGLIDTPNIDRVAAMGLRYTNYHTAPICSATRAALLSGRNPHSVHVGSHAAAAFSAPGQDGKIPADKASWALNMKAAGYATFALGKWDHMPTSDMTPAGPYTYWPAGQGFDKFYGFLAAEADQWHPALICDTSAIPAPDRPDYHLSADLADQAIAMIDGMSADSVQQRPFFLYWATGIAHAPHHAPQDWIDRYKGKFDMGWDKARETIFKRQIARGLIPAGTKLAARPGDMPAWDSLSTDQKRLYAHQMEVFAAALSYTDAQFGRILDKLQREGKLDDTIVLITTDNGASGEGAYDGSHHESLFPNGHLANVAENLPFIDKWGSSATWPTYSFGWAVAGNTPFHYYKQTTHEGGTHVPMIIAWPDGIKARGEVRSQFAYVADVAPTMMELAHVSPAEIINNVRQQPMEGVSFGYTLADPKAERSRAQYFELWGNKSLWSNGWTIVTSHRLHSWDMSVTTPITEPWELYDVRKDPGQTVNLAARYPAKVSEMAALYDEQAKRYDAISVNAGAGAPEQIASMKAAFAARGGKWTYTGPISQVAEGAGPPVQVMPFNMTTALDLPTGKETGPIFALGGKLGGMSLYLKDGVPKFTLTWFDGSSQTITGDAPLPKGATALELSLDRQPAKPLTEQNVGVTIKANGRMLASTTVTYAMPARFGVSQTFDIGNDFGDSVSDDYKAGAPFPGNIGKTTFDFNRR